MKWIFFMKKKIAIFLDSDLFSGGFEVCDSWQS